MKSIYDEFHAERIRAHEKHDSKGGSMERKDWRDPIWLPVLVEEVGEVARALEALANRDQPRTHAHLREELVQVGAMTAAWIDALDYVEDPEVADIKRVHSMSTDHNDSDCPRCAGGFRFPTLTGGER